MRRLLFALTAVLLLAACEGTQFVVCDCSANLYDCSDFASQADAQACHDSCYLQTQTDVHQLDSDGNGRVCESLNGSSVDSPTLPDPELPPNTVVDDVQPDEIGVVVDIIDGDTADVELDGLEFRVRYIGVNTPERDEACYNQATNANADLVEGREVYLVRDISETDRFDRLLRYIYVPQGGGDFLFVNAALVAAGYAEAVRFEPDTAFAPTFEALEAEARAANLGCHPSGVFND